MNGLRASGRRLCNECETESGHAEAAGDQSHQEFPFPMSARLGLVETAIRGPRTQGIEPSVERYLVETALAFVRTCAIVVNETAVTERPASAS